MKLAKGACPRAILARLAPIMIGSAVLAGCQAAGHVSPPEVRADAWRVIERIGEARYLAPGASSWAAALSATTLPGGSRVATGAGGRLILARAGDHVSAGPGSEFSLPDSTSEALLKQTAGRLRYRLGGASPFTIATPAAALEPRSSVFDVTVGTNGTEVTVEHGQLRVATLDGQRQIELEAGQSAHAGGRETLAFRRAHGQPLQRAPRIVLPALKGKPAVTGGAPFAPSLTAAEAGTDQPATSAAAGIDSVATTGPTADATGGEVAPAAPAALPAATEANAGTANSAAPAPGRPTVNVEPPMAPAPGAAPMAGGSPAIGAVRDVPPTAHGDSAVAPAAVVAPTSHGPSSVAPAPDADASAQVLGEDHGSVFDRLTEGMTDALPAQLAPQASSIHGRSN